MGSRCMAKQRNTQAMCQTVLTQALVLGLWGVSTATGAKPPSPTSHGVTVASSSLQPRAASHAQKKPTAEQRVVKLEITEAIANKPASANTHTNKMTAANGTVQAGASDIEGDDGGEVDIDTAVPPNSPTVPTAIANAGFFMEKGGVFLFDMNTPYKHQKVLGDNEFTFEEEDAACVWRNHYNAADRKVEITVDIDYHETGEHFHEEFCEYTYDLATIRAALEKHGFALESVCDGETFGPLTEEASGLLIMAVVMLHNSFGYLLGYFTGRLFKLPLAQRKSLALEVGMQNSGLGAALASAHFSPPFPTSIRFKDTISPTIVTSAAPLTFGTVSSMDLPEVVTSSIIITRSPSFNLLPRKLPLSAP